MQLKEYLSGLPRGTATELAEKLAISLSFLSQMASGVSAISPERCVAIEQATVGMVTRKELRPNDWDRIWPELAEKAVD